MGTAASGCPCCRDDGRKADGSISRAALYRKGSSKLGGFALMNFSPSNPGKVEDFFDFDASVLGEGGFGTVRRGRDKRTGETFAIKRVMKDEITNPDSLGNFDEEIEIMRVLDHPNIIRFRESFQDLKQIHLVLEYCDGGDLLDRIEETVLFTEDTAGHLIHQMLLAINYLHGNRIIHRDLKPENWMFATREEIDSSRLKLIDFGLSRRFNPGAKLETKVGTPCYVAPEVMCGKYDAKADVWSLGVTMYLLLSGELPFAAKSTQEVIDMVIVSVFKMTQEVWDRISEDAKSLVKSCLEKKVKKRLTAEEALQNPWIVAAGTPHSQRATEGLRTSVHQQLGNVKSFGAMHKVKKATLTVIATQLTEDSIQELRQIFLMMDQNRDGTLSMREVRQVIAHAGARIPSNLDHLLAEMDSDGSGAIDYTEFLAATLDKKHYYQKDAVWNAFKRFDIDGSGSISKKELQKVLGDQSVQDAMNLKNDQVESELDRIFQDIDENGDGLIDFEEFFSMVGGDRALGRPIGYASPTMHPTKYGYGL